VTARWICALAGSAVAATLLLPARPAAAAQHKVPQWPKDSVPGSLLVTTGSDADAVRLAAEQHAGRAGRTVLVHVRPGTEAAVAAGLGQRRGVLAVEPDHLRHALRLPNDPEFGQQWSHTLGRTPTAWDTTTGSRDVKVAVIDTGIDGTHAELRPNILKQVDVSQGVVNSVAVGTDNDPCAVGHGTEVAGVIGAVGDNSSGIAGVAWSVGLVDVAAADREACGLFADSAIVTGITYAANFGVDVINLSLGAPSDTCPTAFQTAIDAARSAGAVVVAAAGNEEEFAAGLTSIPASCNGVVSVGAVDETGAHASYSNSNAEVDLAAPGGGMSGPGILTTAHGGGTTRDIGTSFASPYVAGVAALVRTVNDELSADQVESILESTTRTHGVRSAGLGWGIVDAAAAVDRAKAGGPVPPPVVDPPFPVGLVVRVSAQTPTTDPILQAIAMSRAVFPEHAAQHAVLARKDDFADALSGSSLSFGVGPILYSGSTGPLAQATADELRRVLPEGATVYVLGGSAALPPSVEDEIRALGFQPRRLAGTTREGTGAVVADEVIRRVTELQFDPPQQVLLATARNWPDAVTAGSFGAWNGFPVLLTEPGVLSPETRDELSRLRPQRIYVVGGTSVVSDGVALDAAHAAGVVGSGVVRLAGLDRNGTAIAVAERFAAEFHAVTNIDPVLAIGVNLRRTDGFAHVLSATPALGAFSGVFLPIEGDGGEVVPAVDVNLACRLSPLRGIVAGDEDVVKEATKLRLNDLLEHRAPDCPR
jgi:subtilisin family serine protease/putative cell wall-binding protein